MAVVQQTVTPGPCPDTGCPPPTEIVCIETLKVYDFCMQTDTRDNLAYSIPTTCGTIPAGSTATCQVGDVSCQEVSRQPSSVSGLWDVTLLINAPIWFKITDSNGNVVCRFQEWVRWVKTTTLCAPDGTEVVCHAASSQCGPAILTDTQVLTALSICLLIQSRAMVKLLVPSYGFCAPSECAVLPTPPVSCPPELYPTQCTPPS
ncbi:MAG: hypothetical protein QJR00_06585 [Bacillota bacterium]|nr:hypothetical protein [Bacillota bacterium]